MTLSPDVIAGETGTARPVAGYRTDLITLLLSLWLTGGLFLDVWAHNNVPELETFFTPWHAAFYSGFAATAGWVLWTCRSVLTERRWDASIPVGYPPALISIGVFALAGAGDMMWHLIFGIEQRIDILFSPTHLALGASMLVIVTTPARSAWANRTLASAPGLRQLLPAVGSLALATTVVLLFLQYANAFSVHSFDLVVALSGVDERRTADVVSSVAVTNVVLLIPLLLIARRWVLPPGSVTLVYLPVAVLSGAVTGFENRDLLIGLVVAGVGADVLALWLRPAPDRPARLQGFAALVSLLTWTVYVVVALVTPRPTFLAPDGSRFGTDAVIELYTGVPIAQALLGLLIASCLTLGRSER